MFKYILKSQGQIAFPIHSDLTLFELQDYIRSKCKRFSKEGNDVYIEIGSKTYVNPEVMMVDDFVNRLPLVMDLKS